MQLTRLQELLETQQAVHEAKHHDDMDGIRSLVEDALGDLSDKLGKGGSLTTLFKSSGAGKLDTQKDDEGKTILKQITDSTTEYVKKMKKLMVEAESLVGMISEGKRRRINESTDYGDNGDFMNEFNRLQKSVLDMKGAMKDPRWLKWIGTADSNYGTDATTPAKAAITALGTLEDSLNEVDDEIDNASVDNDTSDDDTDQ